MWLAGNLRSSAPASTFPINLRFSQQKSFIDELKRVIVAALEHCEAEGKIKIFSGIAVVSHADALLSSLQIFPQGKIENHRTFPFSFHLFSSSAKASLSWNRTIGADDPIENFLMLASFVGGKYFEYL